MAEENEEDLGADVSRVEPKHEEDDGHNTLIIVVAVLCAGLLIASIAAAFWKMSDGGEPDDNKDGVGDGRKSPYRGGSSSEGQTPSTTPATTSSTAPMSPPPSPPPTTTGTKSTEAKTTTHKRHTTFPMSSSSSTVAGHNKTLPTTKSVITKTTTPMTSGTPSTAQPSTTRTSSSTTSTTTIPPRLTLVCTVLTYPSGLADGACDHIFFDSLYRHYDSDFLSFSHYQTDFLKAATKSNLTHFGISIKASAIGQFRHTFNSRGGKKLWNIFLNKRVYDWGVLNLHEKDVRGNSDGLKEALNTLKEIEDYQKTQAHIEPYMVLGIYFVPALCDHVAQYFQTLFLPRHIILLGQIADGRRNPCAVLPGNNYIDPRQEKRDLKHGHTVRNATDSAYCLQKKGMNISFSVSVEMESYKFQATANAVAVKLDERLYTECSLDAVRREPLPILCGAGEVFWHYQDRYKTSYAIDKIGAFLNTYDTKESFQFKVYVRRLNFGHDEDGRYSLWLSGREAEKWGWPMLPISVCDAWRDHGTSGIGISAYSINADFPHPIFMCPKDKWDPNGSRLTFVQAFRDFLKKESSGVNPKATFFDRCMQLK